MSTRVRVFVRDNVIGLLALFVALSGTALALPGKNTVNSGDIKPQQVKAGDLAANSVDSSKVVDNSLGGSDINEGTLGQVPSAATAGTSSDADTLDGLNSTAFLGATATAGGDLTGSYPAPSIAANSVGSAKVADNALTGSDIEEGSLSQVPSAATAGDADTLDGLNSTAFLGATATAGGDLTGSYPNPSLNPNSVGGADVADNTLTALDLNGVQALAAGADLPLCDDPTPGAAGSAPCGSNFNLYGTFNIFFRCEDTGAGRTAQLLIENQNDGEVWSMDSQGPNGDSDQAVVTAAAGTADRRVLASSGPTAAATFRSGSYVAFGGATGDRMLTGVAAVGTNVFGHDCAAAISILG